MPPVTIALDAMGGDAAPVPEVAGAVAALRARKSRVILLGDEARLRAELTKLGVDKDAVPIRHCGEVITMEDHPGQAVRKKRDASMRVAFELVKSGEAQAVVSAGNSGAMLACGLFVLGRIKGLDRPGIAVTLPTLDASGRIGQCMLLDTGANVECKPVTLAQFAVLGSSCAKVRGLTPRERPRVGLLANGEETSKGTQLLRDAHKLLDGASSPLFEYVGFIEGRDLFKGDIDVAITDGFTGNIVLKTSEGAGRFLADLLRGEVERSLLCKLGAQLMRPALLALKRVVDVDSRGGAPLLGCKGVVIICHGRSSARAIDRAIAVAEENVAAGLLPALTDAIRSHANLNSSESMTDSASDKGGSS